MNNKFIAALVLSFLSNITLCMETKQQKNVSTSWILYKTFEHKDKVSSAYFDSSGTSLITSAGTVTSLFDIETQKEILSLKHNKSNLSSCLDPSGKIIAIAPHDDRSNYLIDRDNNILASFLSNCPVAPHHFDSTGQLIASTFHKGFVTVFNIEHKKDIASFNHGGWVYSICFHPSKKILASGTNDAVRLLDVENNKEILHIPYTQPIRSVHFSKTENFLVVISHDSVDIIDTSNLNEPKKTCLFQHNNRFSDACFDNSNDQLALRGDKKLSIFIINALKRNVISGQGRAAPLNCFNSPGDLLVASLDTSVYVYKRSNTK